MMDQIEPADSEVDDGLIQRMTDMLILSALLDDERVKQAVMNNHNILVYLILVRLNQKLRIPKIVVNLWLADRILLKDDQGVYINPAVEDLIDEAIEQLTKQGMLDHVRRDAERRAKLICKKLNW